MQVLLQGVTHGVKGVSLGFFEETLDKSLGVQLFEGWRLPYTWQTTMMLSTESPTETYGFDTPFFGSVRLGSVTQIVLKPQLLSESAAIPTPLARNHHVDLRLQVWAANMGP